MERVHVLVEVIHDVGILGERAPQIGAGAEVAARTGEHDAADVGLVDACLDRSGELQHDLLRERVARLGAVQRDDDGAPVRLDEDLGSSEFAFRDDARRLAT